MPQLCFGQNLPPAAATTRAADTTPPQKIDMQLSNQSSAMSLLTIANTSFASVDNSKHKRADTASSDTDDSKPLPNKCSLTFQIAKVTMTRLHLVTILKAGWTKRKGGPRFMRSSNC